MQLRKNRKIERAAVNAARAFFEAHDCVFQEVDLANDYGKDAYIDIVDGEVVTEICVAAQIKGGEKYRRSSGFAIPVDDEHFQIWRNSSMPVAGIVHDTENSNLYWASITEFLSGSETRPTSIPVPESNLLTANSLTNFKTQFRGEASGINTNCVLNLSSESEGQRLRSISDCFGLGRSDPRVLITLRQFLLSFSGQSLDNAIRVLTHVTPHPDIFWGSHNWIPQSVCDSVCNHFRWSTDEIIHLMSATKWETWHRGGMGEHVYMMLKQDPDIKSKMESVIERALDSDDESLAFASMYLCIYWAYEHGVEMYETIANRHPEVEDLELMPDVRDILGSYGCVSLFE